MITIKKTLRVTGGVAPYNYVVQPTSCITTDDLTGVLEAAQEKEITFKMADGVCTDNKITVIITDSKGCLTYKQFTFTNPCTDLSLTAISKGSSYTFATLASGGVPPYSFRWIYDSISFDLLSTSNSNGIELKPKTNTSLTNSTVTCIVNDSRGCEVRKDKTFDVCVGKITTSNVNSYCNSNYYISDTITIGYTNCYKPNWDTLLIVSKDNISSDNWYYDILEKGDTYVKIRVSMNKTVSSVSKLFTFNISVQDTTNVLSNIGTFGITVNPCSDYISVLTAIGSIHRRPTGVNTPFSYVKDVTSFISPTTNLDWNTFTFVPLAGQTLVSATQLTTPNGTVVFTNGRQINYTITSLTLLTDTVQWKIQDTLGNTSNTAQEVYINTAFAAPNVVNDTICLSINETKRINTILNNDTDYEFNSFTVVTNPLHGTIIKQGDSLYYKPDTDYIGTDTFTYKIANANGIFSNIATVTLTVISSGVSLTNNYIC